MPAKRGKGRPVESVSGAKTENFSTRITRELRERLDRAAAENGVSLSKEVAGRLRRSFEAQRREQQLVDSLGGRETFGLLLTILHTIQGVEGLTRQSWPRDPYTAEQIRKAVAIVISSLAPEGDPERVPDTMPQFRGMPDFELHSAVALGVLGGIRAATTREEAFGRRNADGTTVQYSEQIKLEAKIRVYLGDLVQRLEGRQ